jgi:hypothetical protein
LGAVTGRDGAQRDQGLRDRHIGGFEIDRPIAGGFFELLWIDVVLPKLLLIAGPGRLGSSMRCEIG